jgi:hypothetical protein
MSFGLEQALENKSFLYHYTKIKNKNNTLVPLLCLFAITQISSRLSFFSNQINNSDE